jgi:hypothetical protein
MDGGESVAWRSDGGCAASRRPANPVRARRGRSNTGASSGVVHAIAGIVLFVQAAGHAAHPCDEAPFRVVRGNKGQTPGAVCAFARLERITPDRPHTTLVPSKSIETPDPPFSLCVKYIWNRQRLNDGYWLLHFTFHRPAAISFICIFLYFFCRRSITDQRSLARVLLHRSATPTPPVPLSLPPPTTVPPPSSAP